MSITISNTNSNGKYNNQISYKGQPVTWATTSSTSYPINSGLVATNGCDNKYDFTIQLEQVLRSYETQVDESIIRDVLRKMDGVKEKMEKEEAARELKNTQLRNARLRGLIENVIFSGPVTVVKWKDGSHTKVRCADGERYDQEKGLLAAMAKKLYEDTNIFVEELRKWCDDDEDWDTEKEFEFEGEEDVISHIGKDDVRTLKRFFGYHD